MTKSSTNRLTGYTMSVVALFAVTALSDPSQAQIMPEPIDCTTLPTKCAEAEELYNGICENMCGNGAATLDCQSCIRKLMVKCLAGKISWKSAIQYKKCVTNNCPQPQPQVQ